VADVGTLSVRVRYFAGAAAAAGIPEETVTVPAGATVGALAQTLGDRHGVALIRILAASSFLLDEVTGDGTRLLRDGAQVDVLPPFAGG
jgi:molybdopterin converting factor small subunit